MRAVWRESGEVRVRSLVEILLLLAIGYLAFHVTPAIIQRMNFVDALQVAAHAPVEESAASIRSKVLGIAESYNIALRAEHLHVDRDNVRKRTYIDVTYELHINFWPDHTYIWNVHDRVEAITI